MGVFNAINETHGIPAKLTAQDGTEVCVNPGASPSGNPKRCPERSGLAAIVAALGSVCLRSGVSCLSLGRDRGYGAREQRL